MNIQNIASLAEQLKLLGFENAGFSLIKRICFKPVSFFLSHKIIKGKDQLSFQLFFEKHKKQNAYTLMYYDAILQKEIEFRDVIINGINTAILDKNMGEIDWKSAFEFDIKKQWSIEDKGSWDNEQKIESLMEKLYELENVEEGKAIAMDFKLKYWAGIPYQELVGNMGPLKNKLEVSQRFYFTEGLSGISTDEAFRFLQNRWLEKEMQTKRKQADDTGTDNTYDTAQASAGNGLLRKKNQ